MELRIPTPEEMKSKIANRITSVSTEALKHISEVLNNAEMAASKMAGVGEDPHIVFAPRGIPTDGDIERIKAELREAGWLRVRCSEVLEEHQHSYFQVRLYFDEHPMGLDPHL